MLGKCGYSQVPGVKFFKNYLPIVNNITFHILLLLVNHCKFSAKIVDVKTTFFNEECEEEIYMECPQVMSNIGKYDCISLNKCIYGLVQTWRQYYKKAVEIVKRSGFFVGNVDLCIYVKKIEKNIVYAALYVDVN